MNDITLTLARWADRDDLVVELMVGDEDLGHVSCDPATGRAVLTLYPRPSGDDWTLDLDALGYILAKAKHRLTADAEPVSAGQESVAS